MDVVSLCPLPLGILAWESPEPLLTVVVKATFSLASNGEAALAEEQLPLTLDRPSEIDPSELLLASDFAPWKALADVLLVGHAHIDAPSRVSPVSFLVDDLHRRMVAISAAPSSRIPLSFVHLREGLSKSSAAVRVGPQSPRSQARFALANEAAPPSWIDEHGTLQRPLQQGFDFRFFNAAPPEQQVRRLGEDTALRLTKLLPRVTNREARLPGIQPRVFLLDQSSHHRWEGAEIELCCDTLLIDTDRAVCALTWRGMLDRQCIPESACLIVTTQRIWEHLDWATIARDLDHGVVTRAIEPPPAKEERPAKRRRERAEVTAPIDLDALVRSSIEPLPFAPAPPEAPSPPRGPRAIPKEFRTTLPLDALAKASVEALPFRNPSPEAPSRPRKPRPAPTLPLDDLVRTSLAAIPFAPAPPPAPIPIAPVAPVALAPAPRPEDDLLSLESFAVIKMELWARPAARPDVLERHGLSEGTWRFQELRHTEALDLEARAGGWERASALAAALLAAKAPR